jgi:alkylation response protein AidB-like acyl-CoA dehydrogenase
MMLSTIPANPRQQEVTLDFCQLIREIGPTLAEHGRKADIGGQFAFENYALLKQHRVFSAQVPGELGGGGIDYPETCNMLRTMASYHPSTALSCAMHQHVVAANRYNHRHGRPGQGVLEKVAAGKLALVSTGAGDWLASNGKLVATEGGYLLTAIKQFASGSVAGDILVTSAPYEDPEQGWQVLHFPVPLNAEGVIVLDNRRAMGMRGTGSNSVRLERVFIPEASIAARRPRGDYHAMWSTILPVALPLIMSVYLGVAETAASRAKQRSANSIEPVTPYLSGEMQNALTTARLAVESMIAIVDNYGFEASLDTVDNIVQRKTIAAEACRQTALKALEVCGGPGYLSDSGIESLLRDVMASHFHPLQEKRQLLFTGSLAMGNEPPSQAF